jgi:hypothetical protein
MKTAILNFLVKNWKTTIAGLIIAVATYLKTTGSLSVEAFTLVGSVTTAIGLLLAKDGNTTGVA